ncbi:Glycerol-3-phosphate acyltransferase 3 [Toxocara canis]|uniref:Glycerol-3-phosphate acyltransferase 3 n=1 Tax=Toxocara canis TaxID=6265 RepID=A0A0B2USV3_TOXCA|nr:Glycerol-3-phosphate acyltransferase 3 [Toxocara canis]
MFLLVSLILLPFVSVVLTLVVVLAAIGKSLGVREKFVEFLISIFEASSWAATQEDSVFDESSEEEEDIVVDDVSQPKRVARHRRHSSTSYGIIKREKTESIESKLKNLDDPEKNSTVKVIVDDTFDFITAGIESIIEDQVTSRFKAEELASWNLLTRTSYGYQHINAKLTVLWLLGFFFRYLILVPIRVVLFFVGIFSMVIITSLVGYVPNNNVKRWLNKRAMLMCMRVCSRSFSAILRFHNRENRAKHGGICVANHTSPVDIMILSCDNCYAMVGQRQGGFLGFLQTTLSRSADHIWFERSEANDRKQVSKRLQEHADDRNKLPMIIFPEGTCINNTSVMMFKKGSFEIASTIYPIAMKYDSRLGDAFWNSSEQSYGEYLFRMMTSWAIICDVWYLPPMVRADGEDAIAFARRVKHAIAEKGGLVELEWDGGLKRAKVPAKLIAQHQKMYWDRLSRKTSINTQNLEKAAKITADIIADKMLQEAVKEEEQELKQENFPMQEVSGDETVLTKRGKSNEVSSVAGASPDHVN